MILLAAPRSESLVMFQNCRRFLEKRVSVLDAPLRLKQPRRRASGKRQPRRYLGKAARTSSEHRARRPQRLAVPDSRLDNSPTSSCMLSSAPSTSVALPPLSSPLSTTLLPDTPRPPLSPCPMILPLLQPLQPLPLPQTPRFRSNN